jgi:AcrR family transcriptional regulator
MREIGIAAEQRNNNVIAYHFGDREGLIRAIYEFRSEQLNRRRQELIEALDSAGRGSDLHSLFTALVQPHAETIDDPDNHFLGLLARLLLDEGSFGGDKDRPSSTALNAYDELRQRVADHVWYLRPEQFRRRFDLLFNFAISAFAIHKVPRSSSGSVSDLLAEVVSTMVAGMQAAPGPAPDVIPARRKRSTLTPRGRVAAVPEADRGRRRGRRGGPATEGRR